MKKLIAVSIIFVFMGCAGEIQQITTPIIDAHQENVTAGLVLSDRMFETWEVDSAFLREALKGKLRDLKKSTMEDWDTLDKWAKGKRTDPQRIRALILRVRMSEDILGLVLKMLPGPIYERIIGILW